MNTIETSAWSTPKQGPESRLGRAGWYKYYAGFSSRFVEDVMRSAPMPLRVLDPWNGSGTTTQIAYDLGHQAIGFDLNPAMVLVAKARTLDMHVKSQLNGAVKRVLDRLPSSLRCFPVDPLEQWLAPRTARGFRQIERAIYSEFVDPYSDEMLAKRQSLAGVSGLAAFFYVALFRALTGTLSAFKGSNPTWIKAPINEHDKVTIAEFEILRMFRAEIADMTDLTGPETFRANTDVPPPLLDTGTSSALNVDKRSIDLVVASPPYCTRIDYVIKTAPELALLGATEQRTRELRELMIGTPTIASNLPVPRSHWGPTCLLLLSHIYDHPSRASQSYYWKTYLQYFDGLFRSLNEIGRVLTSAGRCVIVVQDSYYKDVQVDLARIVIDMASSISMECIQRADFPNARSMVSLNAKARIYSRPVSSKETVLTLKNVSLS